jgi:hypothetical protein
MAGRDACLLPELPEGCLFQALPMLEPASYGKTEPALPTAHEQVVFEEGQPSNNQVEEPPLLIRTEGQPVLLGTYV